MRNLRRSNREEEEEESVFVPMTDMTVSFLFILMILLAFFAVRFSDKDTVPRSVHEAMRTDFEIKIDEKNADIQRHVGKIKELEEEIKLLNINIQHYEDEIKDLNNKIHKLNADIQRHVGKIKELEEKIKKLEEEIKDLKNRLREINPLEAYIEKAQSQRLEILKKIEEALKIEFREDILVEISPENDALRFKGEGLFTSGSRTLIPAKRVVVDRLARLITDAITCYTVNKREVDYAVCNPMGIIIEAVQIEGHTDTDGLDEQNIGLSTDRANNAFLRMLGNQADLLNFKNIRDQPVLSVAGYGEMRPVASNETAAGKAENRRIDLRLIMYTPRDREQVESIQKKIKDGMRLTTEKAVSSDP